MQLWQDQTIVDALQDILANYPYLEYDKTGSASSLSDVLKVKVKASCLTTERDISVAGSICRALERETGKKFFAPCVVTNGSQNWITDWTWFNIREWTYSPREEQFEMRFIRD